MLTAGYALAKSQKVNFWSQKNGFGCFFFFWLTAGDALSAHRAIIAQFVELFSLVRPQRPGA